MRTTRKSLAQEKKVQTAFEYQVTAGPPPRRQDFDVPKPAVFLDRDGTLMEEVGYCAKPADVRAFRDAANSLYRLKTAGYLTIIVTNQSGLGRGMFTERDFERVHGEFLRQVGPKLVDATYFCGDHPDRATARRKPGVGMVEEARRDFNIDLGRSWLMGDKASDIACGQAAGLRTILVATGYGQSEDCTPDYRAGDLASAVDWIVVE